MGRIVERIATEWMEPETTSRHSPTPRAKEAKATAAAGKAKAKGQLFAGLEVLRAGELYEYAVLVTVLEEAVLGVRNGTGIEAENVLQCHMPIGSGWRAIDSRAPCCTPVSGKLARDRTLPRMLHGNAG